MLSITARLITIAAISALVASCSGLTKNTKSPAQILGEALGGGQPEVGRTPPLVGAEWSDLPYVPIMTPPDVARIWIYDHVTPTDDLVVGHWIFVKLRDERWYIQDQWQNSAVVKPALMKVPLPPKSSFEEKSLTTGSLNGSQTGLKPEQPLQ